MSFKDRISTILHIHMVPISSPGSFQSQSTVATALPPPPTTPANSATNSATKTDPTVLSSPKTITAAVDPQSSSEFTPTASPTSPTINGTLSPRSATSRFASRLSTLPKRILRNNPNQSQTYTSPVTPTATQSPPRGSPQFRSNGLGKGHKYTKPTGTRTDTSAPTQYQEQSTAPKRPLTYHQPPLVMPNPGPDRFQSFLEASPMGPHPGQLYNPYAPQPASPQPKTAADCWDDDPPHVRCRLQVCHWEVLFGDFDWSRNTQSPKRGRGRKKHDSGDVSPRSQSPRSSTTSGERGSFRMHEEEHRGRTKERERDWNTRPGYELQTRNGSSGSFWNQAGSNPGPHPYRSRHSHTPEHTNGAGDEGNYPYGSEPNSPGSGVLQARELAQKLARIRMKR